MTKAMYQVYVEGDTSEDGYLVGVAYRKGGGEALVRKRIQLSTIGLEITRTVNRLSLGAKEVGIRNVLDYGLKMIINYDKKCIYISPLSNSGEIKTYRVKYTFEDLGITYNPKSDIQEAKSRDVFKIQKPQKPLSDEKFSNLDIN
jgi:hypothetical protein